MTGREAGGLALTIAATMLVGFVGTAVYLWRDALRALADADD